MIKKVQYNMPIIHFSQWSRKGYALFAAIGKLVRIAKLSLSMSEISILKLSVIIDSDYCIQEFEENEIEVEQEENILLETSKNKEEYSAAIDALYNNVIHRLWSLSRP